MSKIGGNGRNFLRLLAERPVLNFIMVLLGIAAAYFTTIGNIKISLAEKAESVLVDAIDKKLTGLEVTIREGVVSKDQFFRFQTEVEARLSRIEFYLTENRGVNKK